VLKAARVEVTHVRRKIPLRGQVVPVLLALLLEGCTRSTQPAAPGLQDPAAQAPPDAGRLAPRLALFVTADLQGQLTPCGCSQGMRGGVGRAAALVARARSEGLPTLYVDAGDAFFARGGLQPDEAVEEERKARAVADALRTMGLAVRFPGPLDDVQGAAFRQGLGLPELTPGTGLLLRTGGHTVGVLAARSPAELAEGGKRLRQQGAEFVVALYAGAVDRAVAAVQGTDAVDLVVAAQDGAPVTLGDDSRVVRAGVPVVRLQSRGRALLRVDLVFDGTGRFKPFTTPEDVEREGELLDQRIELLVRELALPGQDAELRRMLTDRLAALVNRRAALHPPPPLQGANAFTVRPIPLESTLPSDPSVDAVVAAFDREVSELNLAWARAHGHDCPAPATGEAAYVGNARCQACHAAAFAVYDRTGHAHAYRTLEEVHQQYRLECVACHVVGIQQPGGVCRVDRVSDREQVGCENCHGPGSLHAARPGKEAMARPAPDRAVCVGCHTPENSPHFDYAAYLPRVLGAGHGAHR